MYKVTTYSNGEEEKNCSYSVISKLIVHVRLEGFKAVTLQNAVFWDYTPCGSYEKQHFGGTCRLHHQVGTNQQLDTALAVTNNWSTLRRARWRHNPEDGMRHNSACWIMMQYEIFGEALVLWRLHMYDHYKGCCRQRGQVQIARVTDVALFEQEARGIANLQTLTRHFASCCDTLNSPWNKVLSPPLVITLPPIWFL
jgi:hypothetical protein